MPAPLSVEAVERATLAAVPPRAVVELDDWLVAIDDGTVGRARSAAPLHHGPPDPAIIPRIEWTYQRHGRLPAFRLPLGASSYEPFIAQLSAAGYHSRQPTQVMRAATATLAGDRAPPTTGRTDDDGTLVRLEATAGDDWAAVYLGHGFDPIDGASRVGLLRRSRRSLFASLRTGDGQVATVGCACFAEGLVGIHGMRTQPAFRGRGFALRLIRAIAATAHQRGYPDAFLQVDASNPALALYRRLRFETQWTYAYWEVD